MQLHPTGTQSNSVQKGDDHVVLMLQSAARYILVIILGLSPILFIPTPYIPLGYSKTVIVVTGLFLALICFGLSALRSGKITFNMPLGLWGMWGVVGIALISAALSGDLSDALFGDVFSVHSALFLGFLALIATVLGILNNAKTHIMRLYMFLTASTVIIGLYHILRLIFGSGFLSFGVFNSNISSPIGGWNDLALFFGLSIILSVVALEQLPLPKLGKGLFTGVIVVALIMLGVINFFAVWIVLALVSLSTLMYSLTKDKFKIASASTGDTAPSSSSMMVSIGIFLVSVLFIVAGSTLGEKITQSTNISFVEVRPSVEATLNIAKEVYSENAFLGIGPNRFEDAWRLYKDRSINDTIFWNTDFVAGSGYLTTFIVTTGIFGTAAWVIFLGLFLFGGIRMLFRASTADRFWSFIGTSSFAAALYLWGMSLIYVPGPSILILAAVCTGVTFVAQNALVSSKVREFTLTTNQKTGFVLIAVVMILIVGSVAALYNVGRHYLALQIFNEARSNITNDTSLREVETKMADAFELSGSDRFANQIALYQLSRMNALLTVAEPTPQQQQEFQAAVTNGIDAAQRAVQSDDTNPLNWATLGSVYSLLAARNIEDAEERAREAFSTARSFSPSNPEYVLLEAQLASRVGNFVEARAKAEEATKLRPSYTNALLFLAELDIAEGNVQGAISRTLSLVSLEPRNAARHYQLGVLYTSNQQLTQAIQSFERAVAIDTEYANARYLLALAYVEEGRVEEAIAQLEVVKGLNPDNVQVESLIQDLQNGNTSELPTVSEVAEPEPLSEQTDVTLPNRVPDSDLLSPVNSTDIETNTPLDREENTNLLPEIDSETSEENNEETVTEPGA